ncbi:MAG: carboxylate-amine ligase, partial [Thermoleophilia bacterium]|nr:carboxylate-amine ligase [Thermoleophilia bacterium]
MTGVDLARFEQLQTHLRGVWPTMTLQSVGSVERTVVVLHSFSLDIPDVLAPVAQAYEERFLVMVLAILRGRRTKVIYVTSNPVLPSVVDYWFRLMPRLDRPEAHTRLRMLSPVDPSFRPLTAKVLERPRFVERIRREIPDPDHAVIYPFN